MFRSKFRFNSCRIILVTSLVWFIIDVIILAFYFDSLTNLNKSKHVETTHNKSDFVSHGDALHEPEAAYLVNAGGEEKHDNNGISQTYRTTELKNWQPAKSVKVQHGKPGEEGKGVSIPSDQEAIMKEKFKLNQFNILASDKISLNRSLPDVRNQGLDFLLKFLFLKMIHVCNRILYFIVVGTKSTQCCYQPPVL